MDTRTVTLRDGQRVLLRPIRPDDKQRLQAGLALLSPRSRYQRFHGPMPQLSERQLAYLTEVDQHEHVAWVAVNPDDPEEPGMGVARYVRLPEEPLVAEAAVTVIDRHQGRGIGSLLLGVLVEHAAADGITTLRNYVLAENQQMLDVLDDLGARRMLVDPGVWQVDMPVTAPGPGAPAAEGVLREAARGRLEMMWQSALGWLQRQRADDESTG